MRGLRAASRLPRRRAVVGTRSRRARSVAQPRAHPRIEPARPAQRTLGSRRHAQDERVTLPATATERGRTGAATATTKLLGQGEHDPRPGGTDRVTQRDRAALDVDLRDVDAELARRLDG